MLVLDHVDVALAGAPILRGAHLEVGEAETVALVGRNGAGKTTTLRTIMGFTDVSGDIRFDGQDLRRMPSSARAGLGIGYAPEDRRLFSAFTVEENILLPAEVGRFDRGTTEAARDRVYEVLPELKEMRDRPAGSVSGGQGKMVALARALVVGRRLILLDEPFQGLAPALAQRYAAALRSLRDRDRSVAILITESNPSLLVSLVDRALLIERGEIAATTLNQAVEEHA